MTKKVLIVCNSFYPHQDPRSFRATELAKEFRRRDMEVTVMCPDHEGLDAFIEQWKIDHVNLGKLTWKIKNFAGNSVFVKTYNRIVNRLLPKLFEYPFVELFGKVQKAIKKSEDKFDVLISIAVPYTIHWGVAWSWKSNKGSNIAPVWISDCGDPYYIQQNDKIRTPFYFKWIEEWFMRKTDFITVPTATSYTGYLPEFRNKLRVIPQGFKFEDITVKERIEDGILRFAYAGGFSVWRRDPSEILDYLTNLPDEIRFEFHIYTQDTHFVEKFNKIDTRIKVHGFKPRLELLTELSQFDFMINLENFGESQSPSKLIDYGIISKPILSLKSFDLDTQKLEQFLNKDYSNAFIMKNLEDHRIENIGNSFISLLLAGR